VVWSSEYEIRVQGYQSSANVTMMARRRRWQPWPWLSRGALRAISRFSRVMWRTYTESEHEAIRIRRAIMHGIYMPTMSLRLPKNKVFSSKNNQSYEYFQCPFAFASDALRITTTSKLFSNAYLRMLHYSPPTELIATLSLGKFSDYPY